MFKDKRIIYSAVSILFVIVVFFVILLKDTEKKQDMILFLEKNYNISSNINEVDYLNINLYISNKKSYVVDKNQLISCYLKDNNDSLIELELIEINYNNIQMEYNDTEFYEFSFKFKILFKTSIGIEWYFNNAILNLNYNGNKSYEVSIGHCSLIKFLDNDSHLSLTNIKSLLSNYKNNDYASGLLIGLRNNSNNTIILNKVEILNDIINPGESIRQLEDFPNNTDHISVAGYHFIETVKGDGIINFSLNTDDVVYLFIPFYYEKLYVSTSFPVRINYKLNNNDYCYVVSDFIYFTPAQEYFNKELIHVYNVL